MYQKQYNSLVSCLYNIFCGFITHTLQKIIITYKPVLPINPLAFRKMTPQYEIASTEIASTILHWSTNLIGIFGNILLIVLIPLYTPKGLRPYAVLIMNFAITDLTACSLGIFVMQR